MDWIAIGDIHGRNQWQKIVERAAPRTAIVFVGDYFDSHEGHSAAEQIENFQHILAFRQKLPERVVLLLGNHDYHYLTGVREQYSGYQPGAAAAIRDQLQPAVDQGYLQIAWQWGKVLFSHAGLSRDWLESHQIDPEDPVDAVNDLFRHRPGALAFSPGPRYDPTGNEPQQGPLWIRPESLLRAAPPGFVQVVGHTQQHQIQRKANIYLIDALSPSGQYLTGRAPDHFAVRHI